jgi:hypothetical protein
VAAGFSSKNHNEAFIKEKGGIINRFTREFIERFCDERGLIDWTKSPYIAAFFAFRDICSTADYVSIFAGCGTFSVGITRIFIL